MRGDVSPQQAWVTCPQCDGSGKGAWGKDCSRCNGAKVIQVFVK